MTKNFMCQLDASVFEALDEYCRKTGRTKRSVAEFALAEYLARNAPLAGRTPADLVRRFDGDGGRE